MVIPNMSPPVDRLVLPKMASPGMPGFFKIHQQLVQIGEVKDNDGNEVTRVTLTGKPTGGTFTLGFKGGTPQTVPIAWNADASTVQNALADLPLPTGSGTVGQANVAVTGNRGGPWRITLK